MRLDPLRRVHDDDGAAVEEVLAAAGVAAALGVHEELVVTMIHCRYHEFLKLRRNVGPAPPHDFLDVSPGLPAGRRDQLCAQLVGPEDAAPEELWDFCVEGHRVLGHFGANLLVGADEVIGPGEVAEVGHEPDLGVDGEAGKGPGGLVSVGDGGRGFGGVPLCGGAGDGLVFDGAVFDDEGEFDVWDGLGAGGYGAVDLLEDGYCAGKVDPVYELRVYDEELVAGEA
jgi:hypothetical protein